MKAEGITGKVRAEFNKFTFRTDFKAVRLAEITFGKDYEERDLKNVINFLTSAEKRGSVAVDRNVRPFVYTKVANDYPHKGRRKSSKPKIKPTPEPKPEPKEEVQIGRAVLALIEDLKKQIQSAKDEKTDVCQDFRACLDEKVQLERDNANLKDKLCQKNQKQRKGIDQRELKKFGFQLNSKEGVRG